VSIEEEEFTCVLTNTPEDDTTRRVYADWCDENGRPQQAKYLRSIRRSKFVRRVRSWTWNGDPFTGERLTLDNEGVVSEFVDYYINNPSWGVLHVVLEDGNVSDRDVEYCAMYAPSVYRTVNQDEIERGRRLGGVLLRMTRTQRGRLAELCEKRLRAMRGQQ
jgi:uncharacterized protein (TIGR02996 family)